MAPERGRVRCNLGADATRASFASHYTTGEASLTRVAITEGSLGHSLESQVAA
jgi:hypothetical protein